jgi:hypothetical protein
MKERLPKHLELQLPPEIVHIVYTFLPPIPKQPPKTPSPQMEKDLRKIQTARLKGLNPMYMRDLEEFMLDFN